MVVSREVKLMMIKFGLVELSCVGHERGSETQGGLN